MELFLSSFFSREYSPFKDYESGVFCTSKLLLATASLWQCVGQVLTRALARQYVEKAARTIKETSFL
jgi:hypothetical protein